MKIKLFVVSMEEPFKIFATVKIYWTLGFYFYFPPEFVIS